MVGASTHSRSSPFAFLGRLGLRIVRRGQKLGHRVLWPRLRLDNEPPVIDGEADLAQISQAEPGSTDRLHSDEAVDQNQVGLDVAIPIVLPVAGLVSAWSRCLGSKG